MLYPEVLVIESDLTDASFIARAVCEAVPEVSVALVGDALEAYDFLFATGSYADRGTSPAPQLIFMSLSQLTAQGIQLLDLMKAYSRTRRIPVVLFASSDDHALLLNESQLIQLGVNSYIARSASGEQFARAVMTAATYWLTEDQLTSLTLADSSCLDWVSQMG